MEPIADLIPRDVGLMLMQAEVFPTSKYFGGSTATASWLRERFDETGNANEETRKRDRMGAR